MSYSAASKELRSVLSKCESPIERMLLRAIWNKLPPGYVITPQVRILGGLYRVDFLVIGNDISLIIECDGKKWHHQYKTQEERDHTRDATCKQAGYKVIRFTGRRIHRDSPGCLKTILKILT